jgi:Kdo2-lipid IVA lauroyltransferase/acyltransferase
VELQPVQDPERRETAVSRVIFACMYLLCLLPLALLSRIGNAIGSLTWPLARERREVIRVNLEKCFPGKSAAEREALARSHWRHFCRSFIERGIAWWGSRERIVGMVRVEGMEHLEALRGRPVVLFAPHFVAFDATITRLSCDMPIAVIFGRQKDPVFDALLYRGRARFGGHIFPRQAGIKEGLKAIRELWRFWYMPDMDFGPNRAVFVPFFGVPAATVTGLSYLARETGAAVVPCVTRMLAGGAGYVATLYPPLPDFPGGDDTADARRMLAFIEERVLEMPDQYYWLHKRFKTRPEGEERFYA